MTAAHFYHFNEIQIFERVTRIKTQSNHVNISTALAPFLDFLLPSFHCIIFPSSLLQAFLFLHLLQWWTLSPLCQYPARTPQRNYLGALSGSARLSGAKSVLLHGSPHLSFAFPHLVSSKMLLR